MTTVEYGVILRDGTVAPAASLPVAQASARTLRSAVACRGGGEPWRVLPSSAARGRHAYEPLGLCAEPGHRTLRRHEKAGQLACTSCRVWERGYRRELRQRRRHQLEEASRA